MRTEILNLATPQTFKNVERALVSCGRYLIETLGLDSHQTLETNDVFREDSLYGSVAYVIRLSNQQLKIEIVNKHEYHDNSMMANYIYAISFSARNPAEFLVVSADSDNDIVPKLFYKFDSAHKAVVEQLLQHLAAALNAAS